MRLDHLEPLVHQGGGVDGDLGAHPPRRVGERVGGGDVRERRRRRRAERAARGGQDEPPHVAALAGAQRLVEGVVLGVDRQDRAAVARRRRHHQLAGHHQRLLVGQQHLAAGADGVPRRHQPEGADEGADHRVGLGVGRDRDAARLAREHRRAREVGGQSAGVVLGGDRDQARPVRADLLGEHREVAAGGERDHGEALGEARRHVERGGADRPGGTENGQPLHVTPRAAGRARGRTGRRRTTSRCGRGTRRGPGSAPRSP